MLEILRTFAWFGLTAFGGPSVHIALFQKFLVGEGKWVSRTEFMQMLALANLIPGPNSTETAMLLGHARGGMRGLVLAGIGFITPAALVTLGLVALYREFAQSPIVQGAFLGLRLAMIALVAQALMALLPDPRKEPLTWMLAAFGLILAALGLPEWSVVLLAGLVLTVGRSRGLLVLEPLSLFWFFLLVGSTLFGSGYVLVGLLGDMVKRGWLSSDQLLNAVSLGQFTPGPFLTTATAAGYLAAGVPGAILATLGIFLPSFILTALVARLVLRSRGNAALDSFLQGAAGAALGLMAWALWLLGKDTLSGIVELLLTLLALVLLQRKLPALAVLGIFALFGALRAIIKFA